METLFNFVAVLLVTIINTLPGTVDSIRIYSSTAEVPSNGHVPRGSTVVLVCTETPTPQQVNYQWTCPNPPCDGQYWKVYGNVLVVVATTATEGLYRCSPTPGSGTANRTLTVQGSLVGDQLNIHNNERRLLPNTLVTRPEEIPSGLTCPRRSGGVAPRFRRESDSITVGTRSGQSTTVLAADLQPNGGYRCDDGIQTREFFIYYSNAILPTPQVSVGSTTTEQQLHLLLTIPPPYNSGRLILRYDCTLGEADIEVEYRSADPGVNSNTVVTRSRSCFVVGEISRVTVWFVNGQNISTTPAVVDVICTITCSADIPSLPAHTKPLSAFTSPPPTGTRIRIGCERGYFSEDQQTLECGPQGQWIGDVTQCTETCSSQNLTALFGDLSYELPVLIRPGAVVSPQCREGYQVAVSAVCHEDTTWRLQGQCHSVQGTTEAIIIGATTANLLILLLSITLLVISGVLIVKSRKRHTSTLHSTSQVTFDKESKEPAVQIYDEIDDSHSAKTTTKHTAGVYQDLNINNKDASNQYTSMRM